MTHKKSLFTALMMTLLSVMCLFVFSACDALSGVLDSIGLGSLFGTNYAITWNVDENAKVTVEGYEELPAEVAENTMLTITVEGLNGYEVDEFRVDGSKKPAKQGKYSFTVLADTKVDITMKEAVKGISVKTNPTKMSYYAGETVDLTGMVVEVEYETGRKETTDKVQVKYSAEGSTEAFDLGDTSFEIYLTAKASATATVTLSEAVVAKVVINPAGGTIADAYYTALEANTEIANLAKAEDGSISFTYAQPLTAAIALPTAAEVVKGEGDDFVFQSWSGELAAGSATSMTITANYMANLLVIEGLHYEIRDNTPYLIITGEFKAAESAYLYLYEGNAQVELKGTEITGKRGDAFELLFDARLIATEEYIGKWMDIKFKAQLGDRVETQEINLNDYAEDFCDAESYIRYDGYEYGFKVYTPTDTDYRLLKAVASSYFAHTFTVSSEADEAGAYYLVFNGNVGVSAYYGKAVMIDFWIGSTISATAAIDENGDYVLKLPLADFPVNTDGYAHFKIVESVEDTTELYKSGSDGNLLNSWCENTNLNAEYNNIGLITGGAIRIEGAEGNVYYIGGGKWGGFVAYARVEGSYEVEFTGVSLKAVDGKAYYVIKGTAGSAYYGENATATLKIAASFQHNSNVSGLGWARILTYADNNNKTGDIGDDHVLLPAVVPTFNEEGAFEALFDISSFQVGYVMSVHAGLDGEMSDYKKGNGDGVSIIVDGKKYSIQCDSATWNMSAVKVEDASAPFVTVSNKEAVELVSENGKVYLVLKGTYGGMTEEELKAAAKVDFEDGANAMPKLEMTADKYILTTNEGAFELKVDITDLAVGYYWVHAFKGYNGANGDVNNKDGVEPVACGDKTYSYEAHVYSWGTGMNLHVKEA